MTHVFDDRPLLRSHHRIRTDEVAVAEHAIGRSLALHRLSEVKPGFELVHNSVGFGRLSLHFIDYGAATTINLQQTYEPYYLVAIPLTGSMHLTVGTEELKAEPGAAIITGPGRATTVQRYSDHCARLLIKIAPVLVDGQPTIDRPATSSFSVFRTPILDVDSGPGRTWVDLLRSVVADLDSSSGLLARREAANYVERLIVDGLVLTQRDVSAGPTSVTRDLKIALDYIQAHLAEPLSVNAIASATHMSVRALQERFRRELGLSPMAYVRDRRLDAIHEELQSPTSATKVGAVATRHGVTHFGRFAAAYRDRFGQSPSETARSGRAAS